jgi:response regulator RpfG family c-di-GMP phosphodiesterase
LGIDIALEEIEKYKGIYYDPVIVDVCIELFRKDGYQLQ